MNKYARIQKVISRLVSYRNPSKVAVRYDHTEGRVSIRIEFTDSQPLGYYEKVSGGFKLEELHAALGKNYVDVTGREVIRPPTREH